MLTRLDHWPVAFSLKSWLIMSKQIEVGVHKFEVWTVRQFTVLSVLCCVITYLNVWWFVNREKKMSRTSALKVLDHAMIGPEGGDNCQKFVDILGLGRIFPLFIKTPKAHKKAGPNKRELEGDYCIVLWLFHSALFFFCWFVTHLTWCEAYSIYAKMMLILHRP